MVEFVEFILMAVLLGLWGFVFVYLQNAGHIFDFLPDFLASIDKSKRLNFIDKWLTCSICHTGIVSLVYVLLAGYEIRQMFAFMTISLFISIIISERYGQ